MMAKRFLAIAAAIALAAPVQADEASVPDLEGFWGPVFDLGEADPAMVAKLPADTVLIEDTGIVEFDRGEYGGLELTQEALARAEEWNPDDEFSISRVCLPPSIVYAIQGPFPFEVHQTPELIVFKYEYFDQHRLIFMAKDGVERDHPQDMPHSKMGYSTGHWEGDELVVRTTHIAASTITNNGLDHSDDLEMLERYKIDPEDGRLVATQWFTDPAMITNNGARWIEWEKRPGDYVYPYECDPAFGLEYQGQ